MQPTTTAIPIAPSADGLDASRSLISPLPPTMGRMGKAAGPFTFDVDVVAAVCRRHGVSRVGVFGSFARGEDGSDSDIDLLVEFSGRTGLLEVVALERELEAALGRKVDVLTEAAISPYLRDRVLRDLYIIDEDQ